jgi:NADPH-dependent 2,4-dienoyl-CoA reductase/sulfur reductase-like enzyme
MSRRVVIVGGVAGGATAAARLRRLDESASVVMFERGPHVSFASCGLPYFVGDVIPAESQLVLMTPARFR